MKVVEFIKHEPSLRKTTCLEFNLEANLEDIAIRYIKGFSDIIPVDVGVAKLHPGDNYNHKVGRKVSREAAKYRDFAYIEGVSNVSGKLTIIVRIGTVGGKLYEITQKNDGAIKIFDSWR